MKKHKPQKPEHSPRKKLRPEEPEQPDHFAVQVVETQLRGARAELDRGIRQLKAGDYRAAQKHLQECAGVLGELAHVVSETVRECVDARDRFWSLTARLAPGKETEPFSSGIWGPLGE